MKIRDVAQHKKAVRATWRNPKTVVGFGIEHISVPYAIGGGAFTEINKDIEDRAGGDPDEFALGGITRLVVETTKHMLGGAAVIVLNEVEIQAHIAKCLAIPCFHKETTGIAIDFWFQQPCIMDLGSDFFLESYTGIEINHALKEPYTQLVSFLETQNPSCAKKINMCFTDALNVDYSLLWYDFVFTSPPYYFIQKYENNSHFSNKEEMNEKFYFPLFQKTFASLQPNGVYAINVCKEVYTSVLLKLFGEPDECFPYKKSKRQNNYQEMVYVWRKNKK
jgi:hypothetical protein